MSNSSRTATGIIVLALLAVVDISWPVLTWAGAIGSADAPPTGALLFFALLGIVTLATAQPARRGSRIAAWLLIGSRLVSVFVADLPALILGAPTWAQAVATVAIVLAALGIWWTVPLLGRRILTDRVAA